MTVCCAAPEGAYLIKLANAFAPGGVSTVSRQLLLALHCADWLAAVLSDAHMHCESSVLPVENKGSSGRARTFGLTSLMMEASNCFRLGRRC